MFDATAVHAVKHPSGDVVTSTKYTVLWAGTTTEAKYGTNGIPSPGVPGNRNVTVVDGVQVVLVAGGGGDGEVDELQADHVMTHKRIASLEVIVSAADAAPASVQFPTPKTRSRIQSPPRRLDQPDAGCKAEAHDKWSVGRRML